jgi:hypothetical protein
MAREAPLDPILESRVALGRARVDLLDHEQPVLDRLEDVARDDLGGLSAGVLGQLLVRGEGLPGGVEPRAHPRPNLFLCNRF